MGLQPTKLGTGHRREFWSPGEPHWHLQASNKRPPPQRRRIFRDLEHRGVPAAPLAGQRPRLELCRLGQDHLRHLRRRVAHDEHRVRRHDASAPLRRRDCRLGHSHRQPRQHQHQLLPRRRGSTQQIRIHGLDPRRRSLFQQSEFNDAVRSQRRQLRRRLPGTRAHVRAGVRGVQPSGHGRKRPPALQAVRPHGDQQRWEDAEMRGNWLQLRVRSRLDGEDLPAASARRRAGLGGQLATHGVPERGVLHALRVHHRPGAALCDARLGDRLDERSCE